MGFSCSMCLVFVLFSKGVFVVMWLISGRVSRLLVGVGVGEVFSSWILCVWFGSSVICFLVFSVCRCFIIVLMCLIFSVVLIFCSVGGMFCVVVCWCRKVRILVWWGVSDMV